MLQPKLRFKKFNEEWVEKKIEEFYPFIRNGFVGIATPFYCEKGVKYLQSNNIHDGKINEKILKYITLEFHQKNIKNELKEDDILMVQSGHAGECAVVGKKYIGCNCHALIILSSNKRSNSYFVSYYLNSEKGKKNLIPLLTGNTIIHILASDIKKHKIFFPCLKEQEKIADFLSSVDVQIDLTSQKLKLFEKYKKGITQKIFDQELKFNNSEGNNYPEWEEKKLDDIFKVSSSNISQNSLENNQGIYIIYGATGKIKKVDFYDKENEYIGIVKDGAGVGRSFFCEKKTSVLSTLNYLDVINKNNLKFCYYILNRINFTKYIVGSSIPHIYFKDYKNEKINLPCLEEQQKIADFLSSIDDKIEKLSSKLEELKEFKKGLLQQMFI